MGEDGGQVGVGSRARRRPGRAKVLEQAGECLDVVPVRRHLPVQDALDLTVAELRERTLAIHVIRVNVEIAQRDTPSCSNCRCTAASPRR